MYNAQKALHSKMFAQNFLKDPRLARELIRLSRITRNDTVIEIGPGQGIITRELAKAAGRVIAVESDEALAAKLKIAFAREKNVRIEAADFLSYDIQEKSYKVFSNIPFAITNRIVKKLLYAQTPPLDAWLFAQQEAAERLAGTPHDQEFSILTKPWFSYRITRQFNRTDFTPVPGVDVAFLHIHKREHELLPLGEKKAYATFVEYGYRRQKKDLAANFEKIFTYAQWKRLAKDLAFPAHARTSAVGVEAWIGLYRFFSLRVDAGKKKLAGL